VTAGALAGVVRPWSSSGESAAGHGMTAQQMLWRFQQTRRARPCASGYRYFPFEQSFGYRYFRHTPGGYGSENAQVSENRRLQQTLGRLPQASYLRLWRWGSKVANTLGLLGTSPTFSPNRFSKNFSPGNR